MTHFLCFLPFYLHHYCLLNSYMFLLLIQQFFSWLVHQIHLSLIQSLFLFFPRGNCLFHSLKCQIVFNIFCNIFVNIICFYMNNEAVCNDKALHFYHILVLHNCIKIHTLQFYVDLILKILNKQAYSLIYEFFSVLLLINFLWKIFVCDNLVLILNYFLLLSVVTSLMSLCFLIALFINLKKYFSKLFFAFCLSSYSWQYKVLTIFSIKFNHSVNFFTKLIRDLVLFLKVL